MSRRSPTNERYQKYTGPKGQTRKSAAAAKPSRKLAESSSSKTKAKSKASSGAKGAKYPEPDIPEYKFWRRIWWISLGVGLVLVAVSFYFQYYLKALTWSRLAGIITIGLSYVAIIAAFFIDYTILRKMRMGTYVFRNKPPADKPADAGHSGKDPS